MAAASPVLNISRELATAQVADMIKIMMLKNSIIITVVKRRKVRRRRMKMLPLLKFGEERG